MRMSRDAVMQTRFRTTQCFQYDITIEYDKDKKAIKANPHAEDWINAIPQHFEASLRSLSEVKCFLSDRLQKLHEEENVGHVVFQLYDEEHMEEYPEVEVARISSHLQQLFKVLQSLLDVSNEYAPILQMNIKEFKSSLKNSDQTVEEYE